MPVPAEPAPAPADPGAAVLGTRAAWVLCAALLACLTLLTVARWAGGEPPANGTEAVVQTPISPADFTAERSEKTAPDPGDDP